MVCTIPFSESFSFHLPPFPRLESVLTCFVSVSQSMEILRSPYPSSNRPRFATAHSDASYNRRRALDRNRRRVRRHAPSFSLRPCFLLLLHLELWSSVSSPYPRVRMGFTCLERRRFSWTRRHRCWLRLPDSFNGSVLSLIPPRA